MLFVKQCNALNEVLPMLFEKTANYSELLLNISVTGQDGVVYHLVHDIPEDDFNISKIAKIHLLICSILEEVFLARTLERHLSYFASMVLLITLVHICDFLKSRGQLNPRILRKNGFLNEKDYFTPINQITTMYRDVPSLIGSQVEVLRFFQTAIA